VSDTETIDRLFLELSHITKATTAKELALLAAAKRASAILSHIYHTTPMPHEMEDDAHDSYQALDKAIALFEGAIAAAPAPSAGRG
jgi:hypothetical protein